jgi:hypothetical protein
MNEPIPCPVWASFSPLANDYQSSPDTVEKVENRTTPKISQMLIFDNSAVGMRRSPASPAVAHAQ